MSSQPFQFIKLEQDASIPLPPMSEIEKLKNATIEKKDERVLNKHDKAYDDFCRWISVPEKNRVPKTMKDFERKYKLPNGYCSNVFKKRSDFYQRYYLHMWEWIRELYPNFIHEQYLQAVKAGNPSSIKFFGEMVAKDMSIEKPRDTIQPIMIVGVTQEKINKLFTPDGEEIEK